MTASCPLFPRRLASVLLAALAGVAGAGVLFAQEPGVVRFGPHLDLFASADFTGGGGAQTFSAVNVFASGSGGGVFVYGRLAEPALGRSSWVHAADSAVATRIDLRGAEFLPASGHSSTITGLVGAHHLYGTSVPTGGGTAVWLASAATGASARVGLWDAAGAGPFTSSTGAQTSTVSLANAAGQLVGVSAIYQGGAASTGTAAWLATTAGGDTTRIGFYDTPEFVGDAGQQSSTVNRLSATGRAGGFSLRYNGGAAQLGQAAWVTDGATTHRVGLLSGDAAGGAAYVSTGGAAYGELIEIGPGYVAGNSYRYLGDTHAGQAAWFVSMPGGPATRIGLWDETGSGADEFTSANGAQVTYVNATALVGGVAYAAGTTRRYLGSAETGSSFGSGYGVAAWVYDTATGETTRVGLTGDEFTKISGETNSGTEIGAQFSNFGVINAAGYIRGGTLSYSATTTATTMATWVSHVDDPGAVIRVGLHDPAGTPEEEREYTYAGGNQNSALLIDLTESGYLAGMSSRQVYTDDGGPGVPAGSALWVASAITGETHRDGFTEGFEYTSNVGTTPGQDGNLYSGIPGASDLLNEKARVTGYSQRYKDQAGANIGAPTIQLGQAAWIADAATGVTTRIGLWEGVAYNQQTGTRAGTQHSVVTGIHAGTDHVWGYSQRYTATATSNSSSNRTAWIHHVATGAQTVFELAQSDASGLGFSVVTGMTSGGVAYGHYTTYQENTDTGAGNRAYIWSETLGTRTLDSVVGAARLAEHGWACLSSVTAAEDDGAGLLTLVGAATLTAGGTEAYLLTLDLDGGSDPGAGELAVFFDWLTAQGLPADVASHTADPDGDGVPALLEFALGESAVDASGATRIEAIVVDVDGIVYPGVRYTSRREKGGVTLAVEHAGGDLVFPSATVLHPHATTDLGGGVDRVEVRSDIPLAIAPRQFFRLRATLPVIDAT